MDRAVESEARKVGPATQRARIAIFLNRRISIGRAPASV